MGDFLKIILAAALATASFAAPAVDEAYKDARKQAKAAYKADKKACQDLSREERKTCMSEAKARRDEAMRVAQKLKSTGGTLHGDASQAARAPR